MVVLPEPEGPRSTRNSPECMVKFNSSITETLPKVLETLLSLMSAIIFFLTFNTCRKCDRLCHLALEEEIEHSNRKPCQHRGSKSARIINPKGIVHLRDADRHRHGFVFGCGKEGPEKSVPCPDEHHNGQSRCNAPI